MQKKHAGHSIKPGASFDKKKRPQNLMTKFSIFRQKFVINFMKSRAIILLIVVSGCTQQQEQNPIPDTFNSLDAWQAHASNQVRNWVPLGTPAVDARRVMEQYQFTTITNCPSFLECYFRSLTTWTNPVEENIDVWFYLNDGKVSREQVFTSLKGP
jgi:hypothetical protein